MTLIGGNTEIVYAQEPVEVERKVVLIEVETPEKRVQRLIREAFPEAPIMVEVARCESQFKATAHNTTLNTDGTTDGGVFQLNTVHDKELETLGLDKWKVEDNIAFARILYDRGGLQPWKGSKHCWNK